MEPILAKLQTEIEDRKRPRVDVRPYVYTIFSALLILWVGVLLGMQSAERELNAAWSTSAEIRENLKRQDLRLAAFAAEIEQRDRALDRLETVYDYSARYGIGADVATIILDAAHTHDVEPNLAFEVIRLESEFNPRAVSPVGALGYAQLMPATARILRPGITREEIFDPETNVDLGLRFLRYLISRYDGDVRLALLAYNRGPAIVDSHLRRGEDPENGYARIILSRVRGLQRG